MEGLVILESMLLMYAWVIICALARSIACTTSGERSTSLRIASAIELAQEAICLLGIDGKVLFANPAFLHLAQVTEGELRNRNMRALFGEAEAAVALDAAIAGAGAGRSWQGRIAARFAVEGASVVLVDRSEGVRAAAEEIRRIMVCALYRRIAI